MVEPRVFDLSVMDADKRRLDELYRAVEGGLTDFNVSRVPDPGAGRVALGLYSHDAVVGGLLGRTAWGWLRIDTFWLDDSVRGSGLGKELIARAEQIAVRRGCHSSHLSTFSFQSPKFYLDSGYELFAQLEDYPHGERQLYFRKKLNRSGA